MRRTPARLTCLLFLPLLALISCGSFGSSGTGSTSSSGKGGSGSAADPYLHASYLNLTTERSAMFDRRKLLDSTDEKDMPTQGTATYNGIGSVAFVTSNAAFMALGNVELRVNFGNSMITGTMDNFIGRDPSVVEQAYSGTLVALGDIGSGTLNGNRFALVVGGSLTGPGQTILVNNDLFGGFRGTDYRTILATTNSGDTITVNGVAVPGQVLIIADR